MARKTVWFFALATLLLVVGSVLVGCGPKPPCEGATVVQVQSAQDECAVATDELNAARDTRAELEADVAATKAEIAQLEGKPSELADQLDELMKGSGR
jgi:septal ring factor EnvC (AmiA/AmiB activator)